MANDVPKITVDGDFVTSSATLAKVSTDSCACWPDGEMTKAKRLLAKNREVTCNDATAYTAMTALALEMLTHGRAVNAKIMKGW